MSVPSPPASPPSLRYWTEGGSSDFKDALKGVPYSEEKGRELATFLVQDYVNALHGLRFIRMAGDNVTDPAFPCIFFDGSVVPDGKDLRYAEPGDICVLKRKTPLPDHKWVELEIGEFEEVVCEIAGDNVLCIHVGGGIVVRKDDYEDMAVLIKKLILEKQKSLSHEAVNLLIRMLWPGQSFVFLVRFRGARFHRNPPFHNLRIDAAAAITKHIFETWVDPFVFIDADGKQKSMEKPIKNLPKWLKVDALRTRIRNRVKHYTSERKQRARDMAGVSDKFVKKYKKDEEEMETEEVESRMEEIFVTVDSTQKCCPHHPPPAPDIAAPVIAASDNAGGDVEMDSVSGAVGIQADSKSTLDRVVSSAFERLNLSNQDETSPLQAPPGSNSVTIGRVRLIQVLFVKEQATVSEIVDHVVETVPLSEIPFLIDGVME